jgi:hypothetical protein
MKNGIFFADVRVNDRKDIGGMSCSSRLKMSTAYRPFDERNAEMLNVTHGDSH